MKSSDLKKCVQQHINSSNLASQLRAVSHRKNPFQTTHELISLSHAFNYLLFRLTNNKLAPSTTGVNKTYALKQRWIHPRSVSFGVSISPRRYYFFVLSRVITVLEQHHRKAPWSESTCFYPCGPVLRCSRALGTGGRGAGSCWARRRPVPLLLGAGQGTGVDGSHLLKPSSSPARTANTKSTLAAQLNRR